MTTNNTSSSTSTRRVNPFGDAKPREAVLASKGVDYRTIDTRLDEKAKTEQQHGDTATAAAAAAAESYHEPQRYHNEYHFHRDRGEYHSQSMNGGGEGGRGRLTPSQAIHPPSAHHAHYYSHYSHNSPRHHRYSFDKDNNDNDDDEYTHETASVSTIHSHLSHHTCTPHSSPSANPFGDARPREEVLADKGIDAKEVDSKIEQQVLEKEVAIHTENLVALNHPGGPARSTSTSPYATKTAQTQNPTKQKKKKINPFGDAKPREIVLANKGVDYRNVDKILDRKIAAEHLTPEQDAEAESIRLALSKAEDAYWDANEKELPEEDLRLDMEAKRKELHDLLEKFQEINLRKKREESSSSSTSTSTGKVDKKEGSSTRAEQSKEKKECVDNETAREGTNGEKVEYHFQGRTGGYHDRPTTYQQQDRRSSYRRSSPPLRNQSQSHEEYHGGDARRYTNVERPWYASQNRNTDGDESRSDYTYRGSGARGDGYYRGGRGRGGRGRRYGGRGGGGPGGRHSHGRDGHAGYGGHSRSHGRKYDDNDEYDNRSQRREHWALMD